MRPRLCRYSRRKLTNLVTFPVRGLDLSHFMGREKTLQPPPDLRHWEFLGGLRAEHVRPALPHQSLWVWTGGVYAVSRQLGRF